MNQWTVDEIMESTAYGNVYLVTAVDKFVHVRRMRKKKGFLYVTNEKFIFPIRKEYAAERGHVIFVEKGTHHGHALLPTGKIKEGIEDALKKIGDKK